MDIQDLKSQLGLSGNDSAGTLLALPVVDENGSPVSDTVVKADPSQCYLVVERFWNFQRRTELTQD